MGTLESVDNKYRMYVNTRNVVDGHDVVDIKAKGIQESEDYSGDLIRHMLSGLIEANPDEILEELDKMNLFPDELFDAFSGYDCYDLRNNKDFILNAIQKTGGICSISVWASADVIKQILQDRELIEQIIKKEIKIPNFLNGEENIAVFIYQLMQYDELCQDKEFMMQLINTLTDIARRKGFSSFLGEQWVDEAMGLIISTVILEKCQGILGDRDFEKCVLDFIDQVQCEGFDFGGFSEKLLATEELSKDEELAYKYVKRLGSVRNISPNLLKKRDFLESIIESYSSIGKEFYLPKEFCSNIEIVKKYLKKDGSYQGISLEILNNPEIAEIINQYYREDPNEMMLDEIAKKIEETGTVVTHFGDDLDNKAAIEAIQKWAEDNDLIKIGYPLKVIRVPAGQVKEGYLNIDTGGHKGSTVEADGTIVIDGDLRYGVKSACEALSKLDIYVPDQIVELADTKPNKVSALDSRSGLALVRYLSGEQTFKLAEAGLLDKTLDDEQIEEFGLTEAHKKQQQIIDNAVKKIAKYTVEMPNGEKIVLSPESILAGSAIAYEKGIKYFVSASEHLDADKNVDGVTFAITSKLGSQLPDELLAYGKELAEIYRIDDNSSGVFVSPNNQMIVAGGPKNPSFRIPNETVDGILDIIKEKFIGKTCMHSMEEIVEYVGSINDAEKIAQTMGLIINEQLRNSREDDEENLDERK